MRNNTVLEPAVTEDRKTGARHGLNGTHHAEPAAKAQDVLLVGFDWGTNKSCLQASYAGSTELAASELVPTVVGYASETIVEDLLPGNAKVLFGAEALQHRLHLRLVAPMVDGVVQDLAAAKDFARHLRGRLDVPQGTQLRAVIGVPANTNNAGRESMRQAVSTLFDRVILIPEPFLAALGCREESRLNEAGYVDPVKNSLFVDIGAGTTDICLVQGYFPTVDDQICLPFAGDKVDALVAEGISKTYPDTALSLLTVRDLKEKHARVGQSSSPIEAKVMVGGKPRKLDLTTQITGACDQLLKSIFEAVQVLIGRASSESVGDLLQNIILTGGGSRIRGLDTELQRLLAEEGYESPKVRLAGEDYKEYVARGALKAARQAKEHQWQKVLA